MEAESAVVDRYKPRGLARVLLAVGSSVRGLSGAFREEGAFRQELAFAVLVIPLGLWLGHSGIERALLIGPMLLILIVELLNSAIEATMDRIGFERHALAGLAKDIEPAAVEGNPDWTETLERIAGSVVSIDVDSTRAFDTEWNSTAQATGFVVDAERGLILTNRHVVTPGPVTAEATFLNREEVQLFPVYRDPVHDFGIYRYDPQKLRFIKPKALPLYPEGAQIGREIRVVGNNAGEQL